jgi:hypothetical protein
MATGDKYEGDWEGGKKNGRGNLLLIQVFTYLRTVISMKDNFATETDKVRAATPGLIKATIVASG